MGILVLCPQAQMQGQEKYYFNKECLETDFQVQCALYFSFSFACCMFSAFIQNVLLKMERIILIL